MKKIISFFLIFAIILSFSGCVSGSAELSVGISQRISTFDPAKAQKDGELLVSANCFEGLVRFDDDGNIHLANATGYSLDKTGCTYTFTLNPEAKYHISHAAEDTLKALGLDNFDNSITADDYVYAFKRYFAFGSGELSNIKNAKAFTDISSNAKIGVKATDDHTLVIVLEKPDPDFLFKLSSLPIYPCSEEFINKAGDSYATSAGTVLSNGPFYIESTDDLQVVLKSCAEYNGLTRTKNTTVTLYTTGSEESYIPRFENGSYDIYLGDSAEDAIEGFSYIPYNTTVWGLGFNGESPIGKNPTLRAILFNTLDTANFALPDFATAPASRIIPDSFILKEYAYGKNAQALKINGNKQNAQAKLKKLLETKKQESFNVIFAYPAELKPQCDKILENWNVYLAPEINITTVQYERDKAEKFLSDGSYDIALMPVSAKTPTALSLMESFRLFPLCYNNEALYASLYKRYNFDSDLIKAYENAEEKIVKDCIFFPLFYSGKRLYTSKDLQGIFCADGGKKLYFHSAEKAAPSAQTTKLPEETKNDEAK